jgi:putative oxidoreductase
MDFLNKYAPQAQGIMRIVFGLLFLEHGTNKMFHYPLAGGATVHAFNLMAFPVGPAGVIEVVAGILIVLGLFSRYAAFIASGEMAIAYFLAHFPRSPFPLLNGGGEAVAFCFVFLFLAAAGPGSFAVNQK